MHDDSKDKKKEIDKIITDYKYGFVTDAEIYKTVKTGINEEIVREISKAKGEPEWMTEFRLKSLRIFLDAKEPSFGPVDRLTQVDPNDMVMYIKSTKDVKHDWNDVPENIKETFNKLGIMEAEQKWLSGVSTQFESEVVYHNNKKELEDQGVIFLDTDTGLKQYPELFKKYFATVVPPTDNKYAALNSALWSGGSFIYIPKGVKLTKPLQSYFRINSANMGQFERTLIIVDDEGYVNYVEGCTAPKYSTDSLHSGVIEIIVKKNARCRYSTIQNWSNNIINLVTQRALVEDGGYMEWIDGNIGSGTNMKYPCCILKGDGARGLVLSIAFGSKTQFQDNGAKMIHIGKNTSSTTISKSIARKGATVNFRGLTKILPGATGSKASVTCDTLIMDKDSKSDTFPTNIVSNNSSSIAHEATVSKISDSQLFYLMSRGLSEKEALELIVMGFVEPFARELPLEYAVELNQLIKIELE
ncbi:MAG: Fe-S cluster assembly protein SufB [Gammaproteobacteria bacterium]|nr:Fe-S cluster assembly protein SufB [Gammaproteobacteria bacterium]